MPLTRVNELSVDLGRHSSVESAESPWNPSPMPGPSSGGKMPKMAERRSSRRHSPYMKPAPASLGLSAPWDNLQLTARPRKGFAAVGVKKGAQKLAPIESTPFESVGSISARESRQRSKLAPIEPRISATAPPEDSAPPLAPPLPPPLPPGPPPPQIQPPSTGRIDALVQWPPGVPALSAETREERRARKAAAAAAAVERRSAAAAEKDLAERKQIVGMLREYEEEAAAPPSPASELYSLAENAPGEHVDRCRELRAKLRSAVQATVAEAQAREEAAAQAALPQPPKRPYDENGKVAGSSRNQSAGSSRNGGGSSARSHTSETTAAGGGGSSPPLAALLRGGGATGGPPIVKQSEMASLLSKLGAAGSEPKEDDTFIASRVFAALDTKGCGYLPAETIVKGLFPAFSRDKAVRLRWLWEVFWCPPGQDILHRKTHLTAVEIFAALDSFPEGSRLEEDLHAMINLAAAKKESGQPVRISGEEYVSGLKGHRTEEADPLGLRRRRLNGAKMLRARARSLMLAQQLGAATRRRSSATSAVSAADEK